MSNKIMPKVLRDSEWITLETADIRPTKPTGIEDTSKLFSDEDEEDYETAMGLRGKTSAKKTIHAFFDDDENHTTSMHDSRGTDEMNDKENCLNHMARPSHQHRKRRRSSARFLRFGTSDANTDETDIFDTTNLEKQEQLGEMYRQTIRMNAENKINSSNSWGLKLIDNIEKFLEDETAMTPSTASEAGLATIKPGQTHETKVANDKRINFTKASCTLDASVKIYSYRVDDVYLSSYKVLANLNRTDVGTIVADHGGIKNNEQDSVMADRFSDCNKTHRRQKEHRVFETLETNVANINITKIDAAFDIDPLFLKMSREFDEGGAKGLLLVNIGVACDGCRLALDSKEDSIVDCASDVFSLCDNYDLQESHITEGSMFEVRPVLPIGEEKNTHGANVSRNEGDLDISILRDKLQEMLLCSPLESIQLVPQLEDLRYQYQALLELGYSDLVNPTSKSNHYANDAADERAAEEEIHREALERSRASINRSSFIAKSTIGEISWTPENDDEYKNEPRRLGIYDYNYEETSFNNQSAHDDYDDSFSADVFHNNCEAALASPQEVQSVSKKFLDAVCSSDLLSSGTPFSFFTTTALEKIMSGNMWAGSAHWKSIDRLKKKRVVAGDTTIKDSKRSGDVKVCDQMLVDFDVPTDNSSVAFMRTRKTKRDKIEQMSFSRVLNGNISTDRFVLPYDAGIDANQLSKLFLRPDDIYTMKKCDSSHNITGVSTHQNTSFRCHDKQWDESFDAGSNDSPGFCLPDADREVFAEDDYVIEELNEVRKVAKIYIPHSSVSKKVDIKALKSNLWSEVSYQLSRLVDEKDLKVASSVTSFRETVERLSSAHGQEDVPFAFYFICMLHLANENSLTLDNGKFGLNDFAIFPNDFC